MNKKSLLFLVPVMALVLAGCGRRNPQPSSSQDPTSSPTSAASSGSSATSASGSSASSAGSSDSGSTNTSATSASTATSSTSSSTSSEPGPTNTLRAAYEAAEALQNSDKDAQHPSDSTYTFTGVVTTFLGNYFNIQDGDYALYVYGSYASAAVGKSLTVTSKVIKYYNVLETNGTPSFTDNGEGILPSSLNVTSQSVLSSAKQNVLAHTSNAVLKTKTTAWADGTNGIYVFTIGSDDITIKFDGHSYDATKASTINSAAIGTAFNFASLSTTVYNTTAQLQFGKTSTLEAVSTKTLSSITLSGDPKDDYLQGDTFVKPTVIAHYDDESTLDVSTSATCSGYNLANTGDQTVTVSYTEGGQTKTTTYTIHVSADELQSIKISGSMSKTTYTVSESWSPSGYSVSGTYTSGQKDVTSQVEWSYNPASPEAAGVGEDKTVQVTATLADKSDHVDATGITITAEKPSLQKAYEDAVAGQTSSHTFTGTIVSINSDSYVLQDGAYGINIRTAPYSGAAIGDTVQVSATLTLYQGCPQTNAVSSAEKTGTGAVPASAAITSKTSLDALNHGVRGHVENAVFVSKNNTWGDSQSVQFIFTIGSDNITIQFDKKGYNATAGAIANAAVAGEKFNLTDVITSAYSSTNQLNFNGTSTIQKIVKTVTQIDINTSPKVDYYVGEVFNPANLKIDVTYSDSTNEVISYNDHTSDFEFTPALGTPLTIDDNEVVVTYGGQEVSMTIFVEAVTVVSITVSGSMSKTSYNISDSWSRAGLTATATYSNEDTSDVTESAVWTYNPATPSAAGAGTNKSVTATATFGGQSGSKATTGITVIASKDYTVSWTATKAADLGSTISSVGGTATGNITTGTFSWSYTRTLKSGSDNISFNTGAVQLGKNGGIENVVFSTSNIPGIIKSVTISCASYQAKHNISITVGGISYYSGATPAWGSGAVSDVTGTGTSSGEIVINITDGSRALYVASITVAYNN